VLAVLCFYDILIRAFIIKEETLTSTRMSTKVGMRSSDTFTHQAHHQMLISLAEQIVRARFVTAEDEWCEWCACTT
jgi:hypothetical protein